MTPTVVDPTLAEQVGALLSERRRALGLSRRELARKLDLADTTLLELELGRGNPTLQRLTKVAAAYGIELSIGAE